MSDDTDDDRAWARAMAAANSSKSLARAAFNAIVGASSLEKVAAVAEMAAICARSIAAMTNESPLDEWARMSKAVEALLREGGEV